jgi:hypothetical protein
MLPAMAEIERTAAPEAWTMPGEGGMYREDGGACLPDRAFEGATGAA